MVLVVVVMVELLCGVVCSQIGDGVGGYVCIDGIVYGSSSHGRVVVVGVVVVYIDVDKAKKIFYKFKRGLVLVEKIRHLFYKLPTIT